MVHSDTLNFLRELADNNDRDWFNENRKRYENAKKDVTGMVGQLLEGIGQFDEFVLGVTAKESMFRIFRDTRFSKEKIPYKTNLGGWMVKNGRKSPFAGYYLHIEPNGASFLAGGVYHPQSNVLKAIREAIDYDGEELVKVLSTKAFKSQFENGLEGSKVKTSPKGYSKDHPHIDLLRHKDLVVSSKIEDAALMDAGFLDTALAVYKKIFPLNQYLNKAISELAQ